MRTKTLLGTIRRISGLIGWVVFLSLVDEMSIIERHSETYVVILTTIAPPLRYLEEYIVSRLLGLSFWQMFFVGMMTLVVSLMSILSFYRNQTFVLLVLQITRKVNWRHRWVRELTLELFFTSLTACLCGCDSALFFHGIALLLLGAEKTIDTSE